MVGQGYGPAPLPNKRRKLAHLSQLALAEVPLDLHSVELPHKRCIAAMQHFEQTSSDLGTFELPSDVYPRLTEEQKQVLAVQARSGDKQARDTLITSCLRYVRTVAHTLALKCRFDEEELFSVGSLALVEACADALATDHPCAHLCCTAKWAMSQWIKRYRSPIRTPLTNGSTPPLLAACRRERSSGQVSHSVSSCVHPGTD